MNTSPNSTDLAHWNNLLLQCYNELPAILDGPDAQLSGQHAVIAAILAGAHFTTSLNNNTLTITTEPAAVVRTQGKITVYTSKP